MANRKQATPRAVRNKSLFVDIMDFVFKIKSPRSDLPTDLTSTTGTGPRTLTNPRLLSGRKRNVNSSSSFIDGSVLFPVKSFTRVKLSSLRVCPVRRYFPRSSFLMSSFVRLTDLLPRGSTSLLKVYILDTTFSRGCLCSLCTSIIIILYLIEDLFLRYF